MKNSIKKVIAGLSVAAMFASVMPIVSAWYDDDVDAGDFSVRDVNGGVTIEEYVGPSSSEIVIPEEIDGKKVVSIDTLAFASVSNDVKIYVPESVNMNKSGWKPFMTSGAINEGLINNDEIPDDQRNPVGIIQFWGKVAKVDEKYLTTDYINNRINDTIDKIISKASGLIPDDLLNNFDSFGNLDEIKNMIPDASELEALQTKLQNAIADLENLTIDTGDAEFKDLPTEEVNKLIAKKISEKTEAIQNATTEIEAKLSELKDNSAKIEAKINDGIAQLNDLKASLDDYIDPAKFEAQIRDMITNEPLFNTLTTAPDKLVEFVNNKLTLGDSLSSTALKLIKEYKEDPDAFIEKMELSETNVEKLKKVMAKVELVAEAVPYVGVTLASTEANEALAEYALEEGINYEVGEPTEPTTQPVQTSIVMSEVVKTVPGSDVTVIETVTVPVEVTVPAQTVTVTVPIEVTVPAQTVTVPVPGETVTSIVTSYVYVTESTTTTTAPSYLPGDANLDGKINLQDAIAIAKHMAKIELLTGDNYEAADVVKEDGGVGLQDAIWVAKYISDNR